ncbi:MAG: hypothetical protein Q8R25_00850 [bacterium]|nr:hypothetical protein [bacterium]
MTKAKPPRKTKVDEELKKKKAGKEKILSEGIDLKRSAELAQQIREFRKQDMFSVFVFTTAQNATPVHPQFLAAIQSYLKHRHAKLYVIPIRYKNPTSHWGKVAKSHDWWASEIEDNLLSERVEVNRNLVVLADIRTQPTADAPLSRFNAISRDKSAIIGHTKIEMMTVATPQNKMAKILLTTGAITKKNYTETKAGKLGEFHHTLGATVVEVVGPKFFPRQIFAAHDGSFIDLNYEYSVDKPPRKVEHAEAVVLGDDHHEFMADNVVKATYGEGGIIDVLKPKFALHHDGIDFYNRTHHNRKNSIIMGALAAAGKDKIEVVIDEYAAFIDRETESRPWLTNVFVPSNHTTDTFRRWLEEADPKTDYPNATFYHKSRIAQIEGAVIGKGGVKEIDPFAYWLKKKLKTEKQAIFLDPDEPTFIKRGVEMGYHGDKGQNGSRGSRGSFKDIGIRTIIGHSHAPGIKHGAFQVGTSAVYGMTYQHGAPSSHVQAHCVLYENGKRSIIIVVDDGWRASGYKHKRKSRSK